MDATEVILTAVVSAVTSGAVTWFFREYIGERMSNAIRVEYDAKLEQYKGMIQAEIETELLKIGHANELASIEHDIQYRRVDEKVADTLVGLHCRLQRLYAEVHAFSRWGEYTDEPSPEEKVNSVQAANRKCYRYLFAHRPYVPPALFRRTKDILDSLVDAAQDIVSARRQEHLRTPTLTFGRGRSATSMAISLV